MTFAVDENESKTLCDNEVLDALEVPSILQENKEFMKRFHDFLEYCDYYGDSSVISKLLKCDGIRRLAVETVDRDFNTRVCQIVNDDSGISFINAPKSEDKKSFDPNDRKNKQTNFSVCGNTVTIREQETTDGVEYDSKAIYVDGINTEYEFSTRSLSNGNFVKKEYYRSEKAPNYILHRFYNSGGKDVYQVYQIRDVSLNLDMPTEVSIGPFRRSLESIYKKRIKRKKGLLNGGDDLINDEPILTAKDKKIAADKNRKNIEIFPLATSEDFDEWKSAIQFSQVPYINMMATFAREKDSASSTSKFGFLTKKR